MRKPPNMQIEAQNAEHTQNAGGLLFTEAEITALNELAEECGSDKIDYMALGSYEIP